MLFQEKKVTSELTVTSQDKLLTWRTDNIRQIARERIATLLSLARRVFPNDQTLARRYVELARLIGMKSGVRLPRDDKIWICKSCGIILIPGRNCRVRTRPETGTTVLITCLECGKKKRYPTVRERHSKNA